MLVFIILDNLVLCWYCVMIVVMFIVFGVGGGNSSCDLDGNVIYYSIFGIE